MLVVVRDYHFRLVSITTLYSTVSVLQRVVRDYDFRLVLISILYSTFSVLQIVKTTECEPTEVLSVYRG